MRPSRSYSTVIFSFFVPYSRISMISFGSSPTGVSSEKPYFFESASRYMRAMPFPSSALSQPVTRSAPSLSDLVGSGRMLAGSIFIRTPRPEHTGHAP